MKLVRSFCGTTHENDDGSFEHVGSILANITKQREGRELLLDPKWGLLKQIIRQFDSNSSLRKKGVNKRCQFLLDFEQQVKRALVGLAPDKHPFGSQEVDASSLGWAISAVSSREFWLNGNKQSNGMNFDIPMMLPLIDMCNHSFNLNARIVQEQETSSTKMRVKAGCGCNQ
ncbi:uncharacterized protein [Cicer arietinum]|uniref:Uncharacterized protein LOC113784052 n=1 Tax=Cicer arietinum TaxID=3827 RepID=A0A3Q7YAV5_CICAR|nr:uncharacterized protein LOC113784052 [Cicer arietinum]